MRHRQTFKILAQPDETTCGPTCLHAIYNHHRDEISLTKLIKEVPQLPDGGGTLAVMLGIHALKRGHRAKIYTCNLQTFDPSWFDNKDVDLADKLVRQMKVKKDEKLHGASNAYLEFLELGGKIRYADMTTSLIRKYLKQQRPIITGLSATYLYREPRERPTDSKPDDIRGQPSGHFVVLCDYDAEEREVMVADPLHTNPLSPVQIYPVPIDRVLGAIMLGVMTYDANLLIIDRQIEKE